MQINYPSKQIAVQINNNTVIQKIIVNTFNDLDIKVGDSAIQLYNDSTHDTFYTKFSGVISENKSLGFRSMFVNNQNGFSFLLNNGDFITLFIISLEDEITTLFDDIMQINNEQIRTIRDMYQKLAKKDEDSSFLEEIMIMNNSLINTRRELSKKNRLLEELNEELERVNDTDYLTGVPNRRKFFKDIQALVKKSPHILTMMDFNNFKVINDKYGHKRGDEALIFFSRRMQELIEPFDGTLYRLGGDEFAFITQDKMNIDIDKLFEEIDKNLLQFDESVSMSYGSVKINKQNINEYTATEIQMQIADEKMYQMKEEFYNEKNFKKIKKP